MQKRGVVQVAAGGGTGYVQGTSMGLAEDSARSKPLYSLQTQLANAEMQDGGLPKTS